jgi:hypothetical protein
LTIKSSLTPSSVKIIEVMQSYQGPRAARAAFRGGGEHPARPQRLGGD